MEYEELLQKARKLLPENTLKTERFEMPKIRGHIQGNKTIISNFQQIASTLRRPVEHLLKYVLKELATPGELKSAGLILGTKVGAARINEKIAEYTKDYVLCKECGKPDTKVIMEGDFNFLKCTACGAKHSIKGRI
ncbi:translation initiation factor IF-2 subunit beta [Candidatus Woesearchaeota archaeon]|nr:translation initiation factor IF-2 subunit beta [Candidatus Woesearchaeota archaeon]